MDPANSELFHSDLWTRALESYASDTHLSVKLFNADERVVLGPINPTPLFQLFQENGYDPGMFVECARRCLAQTNGRPAVMVSESYGLTVVGTSLVLEGKIVGAAVGGYAFVDFSQVSEIQILARHAGFKFEQLWQVAREQKPVPKHRLILNGELLQVLGDALLRENYRTRQYEQTVLQLQETARAKELTHRELQQTAAALRASEERLERELAATQQLQSASAMLIESGDTPALYQKIVDAAASIMHSDMASMQMLDRERGNAGELRLLASSGFDAATATFWEWVRADSACSCGAALRLGTRVVVPDVEQCDFIADTEDRAAYLRAGIRAVQSTPLLSRSGQLLGMISTHWVTPYVPTESELRQFDILARQAGDLIERKQGEQTLREAAERFRFLAESMPQKMFTAKPNGDVDYFNQQWMDYTELTFDQIRDWGWTQFVHPDDLAENVRIWKHSIATGEPFHFEHRFRDAGGNYRWHLSRALSMRDPAGNITMWIGSNTDIQTLREQEERLRRTEKMAAAGQLAASMAHEINNPLSSVTNSLYLLENHINMDEEARFFVRTASAELARVTRIVKQSLSYYRVGTIPHDVVLGETVKESLQIFSEKFQRLGIELNATIEDGAVLVGFPDELRQVIDNLLLNALEAMPGGGSLRISVHQSFDWTNDRRHRKGVRLTICDSGCGIPKEYRWKVFEPFFTTKAEKGTGLGLWILQGIIAKHEGLMSVRSSDVKGRSGTAISVFLPSHSRVPRKAKITKTESVA